MTQIKLHNRLDDSNGLIKNEQNNAMQSASQTKKTPWLLRFAPGAILRQIGLTVLMLTMLVGVQSATAQITIDSTTTPEHWYSGVYGVGVTVFGLGPDNDIYNYPQWRVTSIRLDDDPNSDIDLPGLRAKIASINATFASDLSSALGSYIDSIDSATAAFVSSTNACLERNVSRTTLVNCPVTAFGVWMVTMSTAIRTLESSMASATKTANDAMDAWINYIN